MSRATVWGIGVSGLTLAVAVFASACAAPTEAPLGESEQALVAPTTPYWAECAGRKPGSRFVVELASGSCSKLPTKLGATGRWEGRTLAREGAHSTCEVRWVSNRSPTLGSQPDYSFLAALATEDEHDVVGRKAIVPMCNAEAACGAECSPRTAAPRFRIDPSLVATVRPIVPLPPLVGTATPPPPPPPPRIEPLDKMGGCGACAVADDHIAYIYLRPEMVEYGMPLELVLSYGGGEETTVLSNEEQSYAISLATRLDGRTRTTPLPVDTAAWVRVRSR